VRSGEDSQGDQEIFLTAYAQYAVPAFDIAAVDYLLKPLDRDRLARALDRARWTIEARLPDAFLRIHRSTIVNHTRVTEVRPHGALDHLVRLKTGAELRLSRTYSRRLTARIRP
jgi:DNA-binding LytR/AlgR family response regulator